MQEKYSQAACGLGPFHQGVELRPAPKMGKVAEAIDAQEKALAHLSQTIIDIEQRFRFVLSPCGTETCGSESQEEPVMIGDLARTLRDNNAKINEAITRLRDMMDRCEL